MCHEAIFRRCVLSISSTGRCCWASVIRDTSRTSEYPVSMDVTYEGVLSRSSLLLWHNVAAIVILLVHGCLLWSISAVNAPTADEAAHLTAGLSHWRSGNFSLYCVNPPLMRLISSFPLNFLQLQEDWRQADAGPYSRPEFTIAYQFLDANGPAVLWYFTLGRRMQILALLVGGWLCFRWSQQLYGPSSGLIALLLWCFDPNILAWGAAITPDAGAAAFGVIAGYCFWTWLKSPSWSSAAIATIALGLAELSKSTWILFFALFPIMWLVWRFGNRRDNVPKPKSSQLIAILLGGVYLLNLGYGFEGTLRPLGEFEFISQTLGGGDAHQIPGNRFRGTLLDRILIPVPENYVRGIDIQKYDFEVGKWSYLCGESKKGGWWYYYLIAMLVKTPLGTIVVFLLAMVLTVSQVRFRIRFCDAFVLLLPAIAVFVLVSSQTGFNRYLRYILPAIPFIFIFISSIGIDFNYRRRKSAIIWSFVLFSSILSSLSVFPHSMSYFNLAAGGPEGGHRYLLDANIDWGQDLWELKRFLDRHPEADPIHVAYYGFARPEHAGISSLDVPRILEPEAVLDNKVLKPGWYAISVNYLYGYKRYENDEPVYTYFQRFTPVAKAGYSIYIYRIEPGE